MKIILASISPTRSRPKSTAAATLAADYLARAARYLPCESQTHSSESALLASLDQKSARTAPILILLDSRGQQLTSERFAAHLGRLRDSGAQSLILAIGPADGWSPAARARASLTLSFGAITLPHELARAVLAEQIYRALTILAGHPYHSGH
jgi:23S rRNA (pseudouridine1915-N3)-methyltransferase